jgi:OmcA/MtrC family decaheme c-type cytochrome
MKRKGVLGTLAAALVASAMLAGCSGSDGAAGTPGAAGPAGPPGPSGPTGPAGPIAALDIATAGAEQVNATITGVTGTARPTIKFTVTDELGRPLKGLKVADIRFAAAKLVPGTNGGSSQWVSYINRNEAATVYPYPAEPGVYPAGSSWGTQARRQATVLAPAAATDLVDNGDGTYAYTFDKELGAYTAANNPGPGPAIAFEPNLTHRLGFEVRNYPFTSNPTYDYVPATGTTTSLPAQRRIVDTQTCNACHDRLGFHGGGARQNAEYCVVCHNPGSVDAQSNNSVDMKVMIHKIHAGIDLFSLRPNPLLPVGTGNQPNVAPANGKGYTIFGNGGSLHNYNEIVFTQEQRNCQTCHQDSDANTPQASNWKTTINAESCGTCHDHVNFTTGANHSASNIPSTDAECATCHGPNAALGGGALRVENVHKVPTQEAARKFKYQLVSITNTAPGQFPVVTIKVTDPTNNNAPYDILAAGNPFRVGSGALNVDVAWGVNDPTGQLEYQNVPAVGTGNVAPFQPISIPFVSAASTNGVVAVGDGTFRRTSAVAIPADAKGSGIAVLEGRPVVAVDNDLNASTPPTNETLAVKSDGVGITVTRAPPNATGTRGVVDIKKCNDCHFNLALHGNNRVSNEELCSTCHNPNATDVAKRVAGSNCQTVAGTLDDESIDFKYMVHSIHAGADYTACGYGNTGYDFSHVNYPGRLNNCEGCHTAGKYYPNAALNPITKDAGPTDPATGAVTSAALRFSLTDDVGISGQAATCSACHRSDLAATHMKQNGADFAARKTATGTQVGGSQETCTVCHGQGRSADVKEVHGVGTFKFN